MKIRKDGTIKLQKGDRRVANFIVHDEGDKVKVADIGGKVTWRIAKDNLSGALLDSVLNNRDFSADITEHYLHNYAAAIFLVLQIPFDTAMAEKFLAFINDAQEYVADHPELYGKQPRGDDQHERITEEERELHQEIEEMSEEG